MTCGVKGFIYEQESGRSVPGAYIVVEGINHKVMSAEFGDYWRLLAPGNYRIRVEGSGYQATDWQEVTVPECTPCKLHSFLHFYLLRNGPGSTTATTKTCKFNFGKIPQNSLKNVGNL